MAYEAEKIAGAEMLVRLVNAVGDPPEMIVQVGVGYGHVEVPVLRAAWPQTWWVGFEPNPEIPIPDYPGLLYRTALSNFTGFNTLFVPDLANRGSLLPVVGCVKRMQVPVNRLRQMLGKPTDERVLLWLDCEGSELDVLKGADEWIDNTIAVNVELWDRPPTWGWPGADELDAWLGKHGFHCVGEQRLWPEFGIRDAVYLRRS